MPTLTDPTAPRTGFDPASVPTGQIYHLINSIVAPRPIAWVSTRSASGVANVAPHSYCMIVSANPPIIAFSSTGDKDTLRNIRATGEFVFNQVSEALAEEMNLSSANFPADTSEFDWTGLTPAPSVVVGAPRVGESPAAMECRLLDIQEYGAEPAHLIIGQVVHIAVDSAFLKDGILDYTQTRPVGRLARIGYSFTREFFAMPRPTYQGLLDAGAQPKRRG
ncbi:MAG: flavin reductase family protein [Chloroflexota bacterium]|nr:flavin reductase family protein [Chloroflexota bacterium]MDQ6907851.1 flavin reductase family protein [Chloroflexota bacterium]